MKNISTAPNTLFIGLFSIIFFILPLFSSAYFTTNQKEINLGNGTGLFLIEYKFGMNKYDVYIPILAETNVEQKDSVVSYEILDKDDNIVLGNMSGIVLSETPINDGGMYVTPKGKIGTFTLVVFYTPDTSVDAEKYRLHVNYLPFQFNGTQQLQLNPSELKYYTTKPLKL